MLKARDFLGPPTDSSSGTTDSGLRPLFELGRLRSVLKETFSQWSAHQGSRLAASLACYTLLSLAPLVVFSVVVAGVVFGERAARGEIAAQLGAVVGQDAALAIQAIAFNAREPRSGLVGSIVGLGVLLFGASRVFGELESALNEIWGVARSPGRGLRGMARDRFFSFALVLAVAFLLLVSLLVSTAIAAVGKFAASHLPGGAVLWQLMNLAIGLAVTTMLFGLIFKVIPRAWIAWTDVAVGAALTAVLFTVGKFLLAIYIGRSSVTSAFGAAGSLVALVVWVYYSSQMLFFGAIFASANARLAGVHVQPKKNAVVIRE